MKNIFFVTLSVILISLALPARAAGGPTGVGAIIGDPTGVSVKNWLTETTAIDAAFAWTLNSSNAFDAQADYLLHVPNLVRIGDAEFALHYGFGGVVVFSHVSAFAVRVPVGLSHRFEANPVDIFIETAGLLFLAPNTDFQMQVGVGARYYF